MSQTYTDDDRQEALELLAYNRNNVALTAVQTGIPERTLREWRRIKRIEGRLPPNPPLPAAAADSTSALVPPRAALSDRFDEVSDALSYVNERVLQQLVELADSLPQILATAPPYHQLLALTQLIDRVEKLQSLIPRTAREQTVRIEFVDPDTGSVHTTPYWQHRSYDDD